MSPLQSPEQVLALAPDAPSAKAGQGLSHPRKWLSAGRLKDEALWGECQGSGSTPYQTQVDLTGPAFRCSCPSRKFPCKHGLGLMLMGVAHPDAVPEAAAPPAWVEAWLSKRRAQAAADHAPSATAGGQQEGAAPSEQSSRQAARRAEAREGRVRAGLQELDRWLADTIRRGLASPETGSPQEWEAVAARLVTAQAPGAARRVRAAARLPHSGDGWHESLLSQLARLHLLTEAYTRIERLPPPVQTDLRTAVGWTQRTEEVLANAGVRDRWRVIGQRTAEVDERLTTRRTYLHGETTDRSAVIVSYTAVGQPPSGEIEPLSGTQLDATLAFYDGNLPLRAVVQSQHGTPEPLTDLPGYGNLEAALTAYSDALGANPWIEHVPWVLQDVIPIPVERGWVLRDRSDQLLPLHPRFRSNETLLALSGGYRVSVMGEWSGHHLWPLSVWTGERFYPFQS